MVFLSPSTLAQGARPHRPRRRTPRILEAYKKLLLRPRTWLQVLVALLVIAAAVRVWEIFPVNDYVRGFSGWAEAQGTLGAVFFLVIYVAGALLMLPEGLLTIAAGVAYGFLGAVLVFVAALIGAVAAFLIARYFARARVQSWISKRRRLAAIHQAVADEGWPIVLLCRFSPLLPFVVQNYLFGVTEIRFIPYLGATAVGIIPGLALYVYLGTLGRAALEGDDPGGGLQWIFFGIGLAATALVAWLLAHKAKARLQGSEAAILVRADEDG